MKKILFTILIVLSFPSYGMDDETLNKKVKDVILNNPEIIIESLEKHKAKNNIIFAKYFDDMKIFPFLGNENGNKLMVVFYDYLCGYCRKFNHIIHELINKNRNIKVIYLPYPVMGQQSYEISEVIFSIFNHYPEKFQNFNNEILKLDSISINKINLVLEKLHINFSSQQSIKTKEKFKSIQNQIYSIGRKFQINGVPTFIIKDKIYKGYIQYDKLLQILNDS